MRAETLAGALGITGLLVSAIFALRAPSLPHSPQAARHAAFPPAPAVRRLGMSSRGGLPAVMALDPEIERIGRAPPRLDPLSRAFLEATNLTQFALDRLPRALAGDGASQYFIYLALEQCRGYLRRDLESLTGSFTTSFTHPPGPGIASIAFDIAHAVRSIKGEARIHLVGHSIGGIAVRYFVQELGSDPRVVQTISIGSPFGGARPAKLFPAPVGRDIAPGSALLERLAHVLTRIDHPLEVARHLLALLAQAPLRHRLVGAHEVHLRAHLLRELGRLSNRLACRL